MMTSEKCFDEGTIQAFLDGELASDLSEKVACHISICEICATALAFAEEESSFAFAALDAEINMLVPTERIRTRLFETIESEKTSVWQRIFGRGFRWTNPSVAAFASLVLVAGTFAIMFVARENSTGANDLAVNNQTKTSPAQISPAETKTETKVADNIVPPSVSTFAQNEQKSTVVVPVVNRQRNENRASFQKASFTTEKNPRVIPTGEKIIVTPAVYSENIAGEESYIKTIATLKQTVDSRKDEIMKPSVLVAYEKDMAVVDDAITKMRAEVRKNPRNQAARDVLRASYQNKIDLLNSVAEKSELMASMR